jgi:hypothetical protein
MVDTKRSKRPVICLIVCHREFCEKESWVWKILACLFAKDYAHLGAIFFFGWNTSKYKQSGCSAFLSLPLFFILINNFFFFLLEREFIVYIIGFTFVYLLIFCQLACVLVISLWNTFWIYISIFDLVMYCLLSQFLENFSF